MNDAASSHSRARRLVGSLVLSLAAIAFVTTCLPSPAWSSRRAKVPTIPTFAAGEPARPASPKRVVEVAMIEIDGKMTYAPEEISFVQGDSVRFVIRNDTSSAHEFVVGSQAENMGHAETMKLLPGSHHDEPNARLVPSGRSSVLDWTFSKPGTFEAACLLGSHQGEGTMKIIVVPR